MKKLLFISVLVVVLIFGCTKEPSYTENIEDFEAFWNLVNTKYPFLKHKCINWDSIYGVYLPKAQSAVGDEIDIVIQDLLRELHDGHTVFFTKGGYRVIPYSPSRFLKDINAFSQENTRKYFNVELKRAMDNTIEYEYITEDIGYIHMSKMIIYNEGNESREFDKILKYFDGTKSLIIDVRHNMGGWAFFHIRRFVNDTLTVYEYYKNSRKEDFITPYGNKYTKSVVILINGCTISAGEDFAYFMSGLDNVLLVGDTTAGMAGNLEDNPFILPSGKRIKIPTSYPSFDGSSYEDFGVIPDILIPHTSQDGSIGQDKQLDYALQYLKNKY